LVSLEYYGFWICTVTLLMSALLLPGLAVAWNQADYVYMSQADGELRCGTGEQVILPGVAVSNLYCTWDQCVPAHQIYRYTIVPGEQCWTSWIRPAPGWGGIMVAGQDSYGVGLVDPAWGAMDMDSELVPYAEVVQRGTSEVLRWREASQLPAAKVIERVRFRVNAPGPEVENKNPSPWAVGKGKRIQVARVQQPAVKIMVLSTATAYMTVTGKAWAAFLVSSFLGVGAFVVSVLIAASRDPSTSAPWHALGLLATVFGFMWKRQPAKDSSPAIDAEIVASDDLPADKFPAQMPHNDTQEAKKKMEDEGDRLRQELVTAFAGVKADVADRIPPRAASITAWSEFWTYLQERQVSRAQERYNDVRLKIEAQALQKVQNYLAMRRALGEVELLEKEKLDAELDLDVKIAQKRKSLKELLGGESESAEKRVRTKFDAYYEIINRYRQKAPPGATRGELAEAVDDTLRAQCFEELKSAYGEQLETDPDLRKKLLKDGFELD
jgi:hypothetical protein